VNGSDRQRGSVTAELAVGFPVLILLLLFGLTAVTATTDAMRCADAARETARAAARGDPDPAAIGGRIAPPGAEITVASGSLIRVEVTARIRIPGRAWRASVHAQAVAAAEPAPGP
jgi:Flp pilus assembly protein TadG